MNLYGNIQYSIASILAKKREVESNLISKDDYIDLIENGLLHKINIKSENPFDPIKVREVPEGWKCVGCGNYAAVFVHLKNSDWVVKVYARGLEGLKKEAEVYKKIGNHPAYSKLIHKGSSYLILKRLEGITLYNAVLQGVRIPKQVIEDVNKALDYAKHRGLNPYDVHGKNVMMKDGRGYVVDISDFYKKGKDEKWDDLVKAYYKIYLKTLYKHPVKIPNWFLNLVRRSYRRYKKFKRKFD